MAEAKGRKASSMRRLRVTSYSGQGKRMQYLSVAIIDGNSELLTVSQLRSRVATDIKKSQGAQAMATFTPVSASTSI